MKDSSGVRLAKDQSSIFNLQSSTKIRLGFAVRMLGPNAPPLPGVARGSLPEVSRWLIGLSDVLRYLERQGIHYYRLLALETSAVAWLAQQLSSYTAELSELRQQLNAVRLSIHAGHHVVLNSEDTVVQAQSAAILVGYSLQLAALGCGSEAVVVIHASRAGGVRAALSRFECAYRSLPLEVQKRIVVEHDEAGWSLGELLTLHERCGTPIVLDTLHLQLHNPEHLRLAEALGLALATWPVGVRAEVHLSSQRTEGHLLPARRGVGTTVVPPRPGQHADYIAVRDMLNLLEAGSGVAPFDIMIEAKAGDLALLRLREELLRLAPAWQERVW